MKITRLTGLIILPFIMTACQDKSVQNNALLDIMQPICGKAYNGKIVSQNAADDGWRQEIITMHVRDCSGGEVKIALHVGDDRSRTWILRRENESIALRHDHRHEDGTPDSLTYYGGLSPIAQHQRISSQDKTATDSIRLVFPADQSTKTLFDKENIPVSKDNIWAIDYNPSADLFAYEMTRPNRDFRLEFDLTKETKTPPTPWGW